MDKLKLTRLNLGRIFNFKYVRACVPWTSFTTAKLSNLKLKTWPKQLLGYLPLALALPSQSYEVFSRIAVAVASAQSAQSTQSAQFAQHYAPSPAMELWSIEFVVYA